jgi:hypothetical protein
MDTTERRVVAKVIGGRLDLDPANRALWRKRLAAFEGAEVDLVIRRHQRTRSLGQNAWIWGVAYPAIAEALGYEPQEIEDLHYALVAKCFGEHFDARMRQMVPNKRSSRLTTKEFGDYMDWLVRFGAKDCGGIYIELPDEMRVAS